MKLVALWKVPAQSTGIFKKKMQEKNLRSDGVATLMNFFAGFNFFYETEISYGDITEETANRLSENNHVKISDFVL